MSATLFHLRSRLINQLLLIEPGKASAIMAALSERLDIDLSASRLPAPSDAYSRPSKSLKIDRASGVAILPIVGTLVHRGEAIEALSGIVSYTSLQEQIGSLISNPGVRGILLDIASGGGEVSGIHELTEFVRTAREEKPIWAIANTVAASAAYWLASAAEKIVLAPGGSVGSIGVYMQHQDVSEAMKKRGIVTSYIFAGKHKIDGNPFEALADDVRARMQEGVDSLYNEFVETISSNRSIGIDAVRGTGARMYGGGPAIDLGLADYVGTLGATLKAMSEDMGR